MKLNKICCFYASDWHLAVMLLPYINKEINENCRIFMKCENNIENKINILLDKLDLKNKNKIKDISWKENVAENEVDELKKQIYIVSGSDNYINKINNLINKYYKNKNCNVKIINCYEVNQNNNLKNIINENGYEKILNTSGEFDIKNID